jgi:hypothetical protein
MARELGTTRGALLRAYEAGVFLLTQGPRKAMRAPAFDGQRIRIDLSKARHWGLEIDRFCKPAT